MDRSVRIAGVVAEVGQLLQQGLERLWDAGLDRDLGEVEGHLQQLFRQAGGHILAGLAAAQVATLEQRRPLCAQCGRDLRRVGMRPRYVLGLVGEAQIERPYYQCTHCGTGVSPLDEVWGLGSGVLSPGLARVVGRDGVEAPFGQAASLVAEHLGVEVSEDLVRQTTERLGWLADADQAVRPTGVPAPKEAVPDTLVVELDGGQIHLRQAWHELKVGRAAPLGPTTVADPQDGDRHYLLGPSCYAAGLETCDAFWPRLAREAVRAGLGRWVKRVVVLADGAEWIWHQAGTQLALPGVEVVEILDFYHAGEHLAQAATAVYGAQSEVGKKWLDHQCHALRHEGVAPVLRALDALAPQDAAGVDEVRKVRAYVVAHTARMDYPSFRARLFPLGSGAIESTVKNLMQQRQVLAGMRWTQEGAHAVVNLRALHRSVGRWEAFWRSQPLRRLRALPAAPALAESALDQAAPLPLPEEEPVPTPVAPPQDAASPPPVPARATRIQTEGKPWAKGKDCWHRSRIGRRRSA
jgi:hypothetical protein